MAEPASWQALQLLRTRLQDIRLDNGYHTDLGAGAIHLERRQAREEAAPFTLVVATAIDPVPDASGTYVEVSALNWSIEYVLPLDSDGDPGPDLLAHRGRADVVRALKGDLRAESVRLSNLRIDGCEITGDTDARGASVVITQVTGRIDVTETRPRATP